MAVKDDVKYISVCRYGDGFTVSGQQSGLVGYQLDRETDGKAEGVWSSWQWDGNELVITSGLLGYCPLYYCADGNKVIVSNYILKIIAQGGDAELDTDAISVFVRCGIFIGEDTPFKNIKALPPNSRIVWRGGKLDISSDVILCEAEVFDNDTAVDGYIEYGRKAIEKMLPDTDNYVLPLSGGRDSRQILFELLRAGHKPKNCVTCGDVRDIKLAKVLCERIGIENHVILEPSLKWIEDMKLKNYMIDFCALEHGWLVNLGRYLSGNFALNYDGAGIGGFARNFYFDFVENCHQLYEEGKQIFLAKKMFEVFGPGEKLLSLLPEKYNYINNNK